MCGRVPIAAPISAGDCSLIQLSFLMNFKSSFCAYMIRTTVLFFASALLAVKKIKKVVWRYKICGFAGMVW